MSLCQHSLLGFLQVLFFYHFFYCFFFEDNISSYSFDYTDLLFCRLNHVCLKLCILTGNSKIKSDPLLRPVVSAVPLCPQTNFIVPLCPHADKTERLVRPVVSAVPLCPQTNFIVPLCPHVYIHIIM